MIQDCGEAIRGARDNVPGFPGDSRRHCYIAAMHHGTGRRMTVRFSGRGVLVAPAWREQHLQPPRGSWRGSVAAPRRQRAGGARGTDVAPDP